MAKKKFQWERESAPDPDVERHAVGENEGRGGAQRKRDGLVLTALAEQLAAMASHEWDQLPLNDSTLEQLVVVQRLGKARQRDNAYRRQMLAVVGALRRDDHEAVSEALNQPVGATPKDRALMDAEAWRTRLIKKGDPAVEALLELHPDGDRQRLRSLVRSVRKQRKPNADGVPGRDGKSFKDLFAAIREAMGI